MIEQIMYSGCQIMFRYEDFGKMKIPTTIGQDKQQVPSTSEDIDVLNAQDALQPITDKLTENRLWWILEIVPTFQSLEGKWVATFG